jgi:hypothetical protein
MHLYVQSVDVQAYRDMVASAISIKSSGLNSDKWNGNDKVPEVIHASKKMKVTAEAKATIGAILVSSSKEADGANHSIKNNGTNMKAHLFDLLFEAHGKGKLVCRGLESSSRNDPA